MNRHTRKHNAFSLIELLVVIAIVAILAAIAVPNFINAQTRSKAVRARADLKTLAGALETYAVDNGAYPLCNAWAVAGSRPSIPGDPLILERLSTPVAYVTSAFFQTPFTSTRFSGPFIIGVGPIDTNYHEWPMTNRIGPDAHLYRTYNYTAVGADPDTASKLNRAQIDILPADRRIATAYILQCTGPMQSTINMGGVVSNADEEYSTNLLYDPTNGTTSFGNIFRTGGKTDGENNFITATRVQSGS